ncbi:MAG: hypothetical protein FWG90_01825 [Oscillospiraceae bacterium]|nr:hypothetical protein [Oscillospiraceae bacterium]
MNINEMPCEGCKHISPTFYDDYDDLSCYTCGITGITMLFLAKANLSDCKYKELVKKERY